MTRSGAVYYYSHDGLGSVRTLTDSSGAAVNRYDYTVWGEPFEPGTSAAVPQRYAFGNREIGTPATMRYHRYRYSLNWRFATRDPLRYRGSPDGNLYTFVNNHPLLYGDPFGMDDIRIKEGTTDVVQWMPETWYGRDLVDQAVDLGKVDEYGVVRFYPELGLGDMPMDVLVDLGGADSFQELMQAIGEAQAKAAQTPGGYTGGYSAADYYKYRVTCEECRDLGKEAAEHACRARIAGALGPAVANKYASGGLWGGLGATMGFVGYRLISYHPVVGGVAVVASAAIDIKAVWDFKQAFKLETIADTATELYCNCDKIR